jgi:hypothetical protein
MRSSFAALVLPGLLLVLPANSSHTPAPAPMPSPSPALAACPSDPLCQAIVSRLGRPDSISGAGRSFLRYHLPNGDTLSLVLSGDQIVGCEHTRASKHPTAQ